MANAETLEKLQQSCILETSPFESDILDADEKDMLMQSIDYCPFEADSEKTGQQEVDDADHVSILKTNASLIDSSNESHVVTGNAPAERKGLDFMYKMVDLMFREVVVDETKRDSVVCDFRQPNELSRLLVDLPIGKQGVDTNKLINLVEVFVKNSVKTAHPRFFNQLFGGLSKYSIAGAWCSEALNSSMYTYEVAPVFTLMEREIYNKMLAFIGFENGDAIFAPGGSMSNLYAMNIARHLQVSTSEDKRNDVQSPALRVCK
ncbi:hypothetical protein DPMN_103376 [Dreissena polymorpha]|uniref:Glutamate decarboxylase n=1 Tax=Dreissena polymorpha TaxID=45954 RepID=A0A9D4H7S2_DREPO|nr:hypothetical protein DPMN_103376 [Dreissena polymorpha]